MRKWSKKRSGNTESGLSTRDIVRHWSTDNTIELVSVVVMFRSHTASFLQMNCGKGVKCTTVSPNSECLFGVESDQMPGLYASTIS